MAKQRSGRIVYYMIFPEPGTPGSDRSDDVRRWVEKWLFPGGNATLDESEANAYGVATGDGNLMRIARDKSGTGKPIVGINRGRFGFLLNPILDLNDLPTDFSELSIVTVNLMQAEFITQTGESVVHLVFNDAFCKVEGAGYSKFTIAGTLNGFPTRTVMGDGIIVATPQGTSAYVLKVRGTTALIPLDSKAWFIAGLATGPYPSDHVSPQKIQIDIESRDPVHGYADGQMQTVKDIKQIIITPTKRKVELGFIKGLDFNSRRMQLAQQLEKGE
jgi:NAD+ kinase